MDALTRFFIGADCKILLIWRVVLFQVIGLAVVFIAGNPLAELIVGVVAIRPGLSPEGIALQDVINFFAALVPTAIFALYERRRIDSYGLPVSHALSGQTFEGFLAGVVMAGAVAIGMFALGGMQIHGLAVTGRTLAISALAWLGATILVGIAEEFFFRSYVLQTLWKSIGFWPAAIVIALYFAAAHYFFKPGENVWDVITLVSLSLVMSYSVLRTSALWFAVGFHAAFDYMQLFVIGTPNGTRIPVGRMLDVTFHGPAWLTGGVLGTEASYLMYPAILAFWLYIAIRYRKNPPLIPQ